MARGFVATIVIATMLSKLFLAAAFGKAGTAAAEEIASGTTYYVDANNGSDSNDGSTTNPWKTISHAASVMTTG